MKTNIACDLKVIIFILKIFEVGEEAFKHLWHSQIQRLENEIKYFSLYIIISLYIYTYLHI